MVMFCKRSLAFGFAAVSMSGCASLDPVTGSVDRHFGEAVAWNKAVHIVNPDPIHAADGAKPGANGAVAAAAARRYRTDQVKPVETVGTTSAVSGGSGSGGGSGPK
jgi:hypothetical protein